MVALPNSSFEPKTHRWRPGAVRQVGRCPPKSAQFWAKNSHFSPKTALVRVQNSQTKANGRYIHVRLDFLVTKGALVPSNSTIFLCLRRR